MRVLLDTHAFLWWTMNDPRLSDAARQILEDGANEIIFSVVSGWEIAIKTRLGKLELPDDPRRYVPQLVGHYGFEVLPITLAHSLHVWTLPGHHRDSFDRMLVVQSQLEDVPIITDDPQLARYGIVCIW